MTEPVFVDTNVLVYVRDRTDEEKQRRAAAWMAALWDERLGRLSVQVLNEYYVTLTRKLDPPRSLEEAREDVGSLRAWGPVATDHDTVEAAWEIEDRFRLSWWDALIVAAALRVGCRWLLSEDFQDGQRIRGLTVISPFTHAPDDVLPG